jgi:hypothetical protein
MKDIIITADALALQAGRQNSRTQVPEYDVNVTLNSGDDPLEYNCDGEVLYNMGYMLPALIRFSPGIVEGGIFSYIPGSGAFEGVSWQRHRSSPPDTEGAPRQ